MSRSSSLELPHSFGSRKLMPAGGRSIMVCWRCGCWVDRPTWSRITGPSSARGWALQRGPLQAWYTDWAADTWVVECRPNCEVTALIRGLRGLRHTSELSWATVAQIDSPWRWPRGSRPVTRQSWPFTAGEWPSWQGRRAAPGSMRSPELAQATRASMMQLQRLMAEVDPAEAGIFSRRA